MKLKYILTEILDEAKQVGNVYHFTTLNFAISILNDNLLKARRATKNINGITISTTRDKNFAKSRINDDYLSIGGSDIAFELDGTKLSNRYEVMPYDDTYDQSDKEYDEDDKLAFGDEQEEVWYGKTLTSDGGFKNFKSYVKSIILTKRFMNTLEKNPRNLIPNLFLRDDDNISKLFPNISDISINTDEKLKLVVDYLKKFNIPIKIEK